MVQTTCCVVWLSVGRGVGIGPGGRGVTFHSFSFCLPLIAKLLFLREMQGATLNQYFCGAFINYGLKSTNLSYSTCFSHLLPKLIASAACLLLLWLGLDSKLQKENKLNKYTISASIWKENTETYVNKIDLCHMVWREKQNFCAKLLSVIHLLSLIYNNGN